MAGGAGTNLLISRVKVWPPVNPEVTLTTPFNSLNFASVHQKQPVAMVAVSRCGGAARAFFGDEANAAQAVLTDNRI
jgi:hypothetical protein